MVWNHDKFYERPCHHHVTMINGIDPQHLRTVHNINIDMDLDIKQDSKNRIDITLSGKMPESNFKERIGKFIFGEDYSYSMRYADGTIGALTILKN